MLMVFTVGIKLAGKENIHAVSGVMRSAKKVPAGAEIGMDGCASSHHWARKLKKHGYRVRLIAAQFRC